MSIYSTIIVKSYLMPYSTQILLRIMLPLLFYLFREVLLHVVQSLGIVLIALVGRELYRAML